MKRTDEQQALIDGAKKRDHFGGIARAGCGKTTIIKEVAKDCSRRKVTLVVFNKNNANDISNDASKPNNLTSSTFHSLCLRQLGNVNVQGGEFKSGKWLPSKVDLLMRKDACFNIYDKNLSKDEKVAIKENADCAKEALKLMKNTYIKPSFIDTINLMMKYNISPCMARDEFAHKILEMLEQSDSDQYNVDYDDMIRFCALRNLGERIVTDMFVVDECQDNTPIRTILMGQIAENCQVGFIGDDRQAIYAFTGADTDSINTIKNTIAGANLFPLTVNFRCDKAIIRNAQILVPDIKYLESKEEGEVVFTEMKDLLKNFKAGDVGISRYNRVIISRCFAFIKEGKPSTIQGADFGKMLKSTVAGFKATSIEDFYSRLDAWYDKQNKFSENGVSEAVEDRFECLKFLADHSDTVEGIAKTIDGIFKDSSAEDMYKFSTGHKSKGLEWDRVHILDYSNFISKNPETPECQKRQEENIMYIAQTRARHYLNMAS
jgi:superfamily I DNA/RNA helicase